jgi:hypothetical protein
MAAFAVPFSSLCVSTMTSMVLAPAAAPSDATVGVPPPVPNQGLTATVEPTFLSGFRVEGAPEIEVVFGDAASYRRHIDRFFALDGAMDRTRRTFTEAVQSAQSVLGKVKRGACPVDAVARAYLEARQGGETYRALGGELEAEYGIIDQLDDMGETAALTPDYRWKAKQVGDRYKRAVVDLKEMRVAFTVQLGAELKHRGCKPSDLAARGADMVAGGIAAADIPPEVPDRPTRPGRGEEPAPVVPATTITFYVDNKACPSALGVYLDGALLGEAAARSKAAFQALAGHHVLCLIAGDSSARCGDSGTVRTAFLHDGWSIALHCAQP